MKTFSILILLSFFSTNLLDKAESVKLELKTFDEIFGEGWWDKGEAEDLKMPAPTNFGQNVHHQIGRQNTQIGQIEPNSTDQNPPLTEYSDNAEDERKRKIVDKFHIKLSQKSWASVLQQFTLGNVNLANPNQTINTPTNKRN
uniref:Secreted protein n=1 Tax=Globodera rostochiensis TaxID=31243 RepID=A0A914HNW0_GLORO